MYTVYWIHTNSHSNYLTDGYIGITNDVERRMQEHLRKTSAILGNAICKYGWSALNKTILVTGIDQELAELCESMLRPTELIGWNVCSGGNQNIARGDSNPMRRPEQRLRASLTQKGALNHSYGKQLSEEHRNKISANSKSFKGQIKATNIVTNETKIFSGKRELAAFGFNPNCVYCCLNPKQRQKEHKGFTFTRITK